MRLTSRYVHEVLRRDLAVSGWEVSGPMGSMGTTRLATRGTMAVGVKLIGTPLDIMTRLSDVGVTPPVIAAGEHEDRRYIVQRVVTGPHPNHEWFGSNVPRWADMVRTYLDDVPLRRMVQANPAFWRLGVADAVARLDTPPEPRSVALRGRGFQESRERWRQQSHSIGRELPYRTVHPDPHWNNYVIANGRPYLLDWEHIDLSDPLRDIGLQTWSFLRRRQWSDLLRRVGFTLTEDIEAAIHWWAALEVLTTAYWCDSHGDQSGARFHVRLFETAVERTPWVDLQHDRPTKDSPGTQR